MSEWKASFSLKTASNCIKLSGDTLRDANNAKIVFFSWVQFQSCLSSQPYEVLPNHMFCWNTFSKIVGRVSCVCLYIWNVTQPTIIESIKEPEGSDSPEKLWEKKFFTCPYFSRAKQTHSSIIQLVECCLHAKYPPTVRCISIWFSIKFFFLGQNHIVAPDGEPIDPFTICVRNNPQDNDDDLTTTLFKRSCRGPPIEDMQPSKS